MANSYYWIDPARQVTGVYATQVLPFCDEQCWFCGCFMKVVPKPERLGEARAEIEGYLADLHEEIDRLKSRVDRSRPSRLRRQLQRLP